MGKPFVMQWRDAILSPEGPEYANTRLVLQALTKWMDNNGGGCFPATTTIADATALSRKTVEHHLRLAEAEGWLSINVRKLSGQQWRRHGYIACLKGGVTVTQPWPEGGVNDDQRWSNSGPEGGVTVTHYHPIDHPIDHPPLYPPDGLPTGIDETLWRDFVAHRTAIEKPMTQEAVNRLAKKLHRMADAGLDPAAALENSIINGWQGVFEPKESSNGSEKNSSRSGSEPRLSATERFWNRYGAEVGTGQ